MSINNVDMLPFPPIVAITENFQHTISIDGLTESGRNIDCIYDPVPRKPPASLHGER